MNILVLNPPNVPFTNTSLLAPPLDVLSLATLIKTNFKTEFLDMDALRLKEIPKDILIKTDAIVILIDYQIPLHTGEATEYLLDMIRKYKEKRIIVIGKTSTYFPDRFIQAGVKVVIRGIYDEVILPVLQNVNQEDELKKIPNLILNQNGNAFITERKFTNGDYESLPMPDYSFLNFKYYMDTATMITSRGCDGKCKYCSTPYFFHQFQSRKAKDVVDEMELLITKYHKNKIIFLDDNMTISKERMVNICKEIKKRNLKVLLGCLSSIAHYDKNLFEFMYEVGFRWVHFGLESGSEKILKKMGKSMDISHIKQVIKEVKEIGFRVRTSFILDYPGITIEDFNQTKDLILKLNPHEIRLHYLAYRPGTPVAHENPNKIVSSYIHSPKSESELSYTKDILLFLQELEQLGYLVITKEQEWNIYNHLSKNQKFVSMVPMKYGMCWYE